MSEDKPKVSSARFVFFYDHSRIVQTCYFVSVFLRSLAVDGRLRILCGRSGRRCAIIVFLIPPFNPSVTLKNDALWDDSKRLSLKLWWCLVLARFSFQSDVFTLRVFFPLWKRSGAFRPRYVSGVNSAASIVGWGRMTREPADWIRTDRWVAHRVPLVCKSTCYGL